MKSTQMLTCVRRWTVAIAGITFLAVGPSAQGQQSKPADNPFWDRSDTGELVHILPGPASIRSPRDTQPVIAQAPAQGTPTVFPASYGSGNLIYHNGNVVNLPSFYAVYWNSSVALSTATSLGYATIQNEIANFAGTFLLQNSSYSQTSVNADYAIVQQYPDSSNNDPLPAGAGLSDSYFDNQPTQSSIKDSAIRSYLAKLFTAGTLKVDDSGIYGVYFPSGMKVILSGGTSCSSFCGYHSHFTYNGHQIKYAVFPYPDCSGCKLSSLSVADMLTIVGSHEIREAVTDPGSNNTNAWYDSAGYEADDKCAWHNLYQMDQTAGQNFWVQPEYSNGGTTNSVNVPGPGCVRPF